MELSQGVLVSLSIITVSSGIVLQIWILRTAIFYELMLSIRLKFDLIKIAKRIFNYVFPSQ